MSEVYESNPSRFELVFAKDGIDLEHAHEKITATFVFVQNQNNELLTMKNERGWDIPGGHLDGDESVLGAANREVLEEACVIIKDLELFALIKNNDTAMAVFTATPDKEMEFSVHEDDPTSDRTWMPIDEFREVYSGGDKTTMFGLLDALPVK